jgi:hypothetical protein
VEISGRVCVHDSPEVKARGTVDRLFAERQDDMTGRGSLQRILKVTSRFVPK